MMCAKERTMLRRCLLICAFIALAGPASAGSFVTLDVDGGLSSVAFSGPPADTRTLTGTLALELGALPPLAATTSFDLRALSLVASGPGGFSIGLDPAVASPGAGVLNVAGQFLIPTLFLQLDDGLALTSLALANVTGSFAPGGPGCPHSYCLETSFEITGGAPFGSIAVDVTAIPEPSTALLVALGAAGLALHARRREVSR
jgi:hypothetical protein